MLTKFGRCLLPVNHYTCRWHQFCTDIDKEGTVEGTVSQLFWQSLWKWGKISCYVHFIRKSQTTAYKNINQEQQTYHPFMYPFTRWNCQGEQTNSFEDRTLSWQYFQWKPKIIIGFDFWVQYQELCQSSRLFSASANFEHPHWSA